MKVIALTGGHDVGKSTTLKMLYDELVKQGAQDIVERRHCVMSQNDSEYYVQFNEKKVAIVTMGDFSSEITWHVGYYDAKGADILVIANSKKVAFKTIVRCHKYDLKEIRKEKQPDKKRQIACDADCVTRLIMSINDDNGWQQIK